MCFYYPPEVRSMKYCRLKVFREEYFMLLSSKYAGLEIKRKTAVIYLKHAFSFFLKSWVCIADILFQIVFPSP